MAGAALDLQLTIRNAAEVKAAFERLDAALTDLTPAFQDIGEALLNSTRERFRSQTAPDGSPWAALSPDYRQRKKKNKDKILTLSGHLPGLLNYQAGPREVRIGTPLIYGATHQFGAPERNIPARPFLGLSSEDETELLDILQDHLRRALER
ncbi:MAG TPA: phage virion morphogenesis protein [Candidatus Contendobacter sp.]|nr:phage virion morphogenesis protein [Candidatus Contendobacter sp.]